MLISQVAGHCVLGLLLFIELPVDVVTPGPERKVLHQIRVKVVKAQNGIGGKWSLVNVDVLELNGIINGHQDFH